MGSGMWRASGASSGVVQEARKKALVSLSHKKRRRNKAVCRGREPGGEEALGEGGSYLLPTLHHCPTAEIKLLFF